MSAKRNYCFYRRE